MLTTFSRTIESLWVVGLHQKLQVGPPPMLLFPELYFSILKFVVLEPTCGARNARHLSKKKHGLALYPIFDY